MSSAGSVVWVLSEDRLVPFAVREERPNTLVTWDPEGNEQVIAHRRVQHVAETGYSSPADDGAACGNELNIRLSAAESAAAELDLGTVWELLVDAPAIYALGDIAELGLGSRSSAAEEATLLALMRDDVYFRARKGGYAPNARRAVEERVRQAERAAAEEAAFERYADALRESDMGPDRAAAVELLEELAVHGDEAPRRARAERLLEAVTSEAPNNPASAAFAVLVDAGHFDADEDLNLRRYRLPRPFSDIAETEAEHLASRGIAERTGARADLRALTTVAIDDADTTEIDDALAVEVHHDGSTTVHVLIADAADFVLPRSPLDDEARSRGATLYHPRGRHLMLPPALSEDVASLRPGAPRLALDFAVTVDAQGVTTQVTITEALIEVDAHLTYDTADAALEGSGGEMPAPLIASLRELLRLAGLRRQLRSKAGAIIMDRTEIIARVSSDGDVLLKRIETEAPSRRLVTEMMILACSEAAAFCRDRGVPTVFRHQPPPDEPIEWASDLIGDPVAQQEVLRKLRKAELSLAPKPHTSLGVSVYTQVTSPLRRYQDLVMHHQIKAALRGEPAPWDDEELMAIFAEVEDVTAIYGRIDRDAQRYWILKLLRERLGEETEALVLREGDGRVVVRLLDYGLQANLPSRRRVVPGDRVRVVLADVRARADRLILREP